MNILFTRYNHVLDHTIPVVKHTTMCSRQLLNNTPLKDTQEENLEKVHSSTYFSSQLKTPSSSDMGHGLSSTCIISWVLEYTKQKVGFSKQRELLELPCAQHQNTI